MTATHHLTAAHRQLSQAWRDWTGIVRLVTEKGSAAGPSSESAYRQIHQELTTLLTSLAAQSGEHDSPKSDLYEQMKDLIRPWMTLSALRDVDDWLSKNLLLQCQEYQREIDVPGKSRVRQLEVPPDANVTLHKPPVRKRSKWGVALFSWLFVGMFVVGLGSEFWPEVWQTIGNHHVTDGLRTSWRGMTRTDDVSFVLIRRVTVVITVLAAWAVFRRPRSY